MLPHSDGSSRKKSILLVDDKSFLRKVLKAYLEQQLNWTVCVEAEDGVDAIVKAQQLRPDVIVMDFSMPIMNGLDSAKRLRALLPKIPIVMFTNRVGPDVEQQALALGVHSVRSKSDETSLVQSIRAVI